MVDMGMREQHCTDGLGIEAQVAVSPERFIAAALEEATIEQELESRDLQHVAASRHRASGAVKGEVHGAEVPLRRTIKSQISLAVSA